MKPPKSSTLRRTLCIGLCLGLGHLGCGKAGPGGAGASETEEPPPSTSPMTLRGEGLVAVVTFEPKAPKVGQLFAATTELQDEAGHPVDASDFALDATMPSHGHGMMTSPTHQGAGAKWRTEGMKLNMHGPWELSVKATLAGKPRRATAQWQQAPEAL